MNRRRKVIETGKTALIALLAASAVLLGWRTRLFNDFFSTVPFFGSVAELMRGGAGTAETGGASIREAALPVCIVITDDEGGHYGVRYDTETRNSVYDRTSSILTESLGSASEPLEISEDEWRAALSGPGLFFAYATPVKLSVLGGWLLDGWLSTRMTVFPEDVTLLHLCVAFGDDRSRFYFQDNESGLFYGADTASSTGKAQELEIYSANDALFAFETGVGAADNAPYIVLMPAREHPEIRAGGAGSAVELFDIALATLGHGDEASTTVQDEDGVIRRVGTQFSIRADMQGHVSYRRTDNLPPVGERQQQDEGEAIEQARVIVADTIGETCGSAEVFFESVEYSGGFYSVYFGYYIAGGRVHLLDDVNAARVSIFSGVVTEIELNFMSFEFTGEYIVLLPEKQALAAAGGEFMLCYPDTGTQSLQPVWALRQ